MVNPTKTWHLSPTFDIPPPDHASSSATLQVGDLIVSKTPHDFRNPLNRFSRPYLPDSRIQVFGPRRTSHVLNKSNSGNVGFFAKVAQLIGLGGEITTEWSNSQGQQYNFEKEYDVIINPELSLQEVSDLVTASQEIQNFLSETSYRQPLYMITGIKWVEGVSISTSSAKSRGGGAEVEVDFTATGAPVSVGVRGSGTRTSDAAHVASGGPPFIFCVRLKKLWWDRMDALKKQKDELKGTFMAVGNKSSTGETEYGISVEDVGNNEFEDSGSVAFTAEQDGGQEEEIELVFDEDM